MDQPNTLPNAVADFLYSVNVDYSMPTDASTVAPYTSCKHKYFDWLNKNDIHTYRWAYYGSSMRFGFDSEEELVKFALRWA